MSGVSDEIRAQYEYYTDERLLKWRRIGARDKAQNVLNFIKEIEVRSIIDLGCGDGAVADQLMQLGFRGRYLGLDISASGVAAARSRGLAPKAEFETFDGATVPSNSGSFDLAILSHVVEHLEHPRILLAEAMRTANWTYVEVPLEHTLRMKPDYIPDSVGHINFYTPATIRRLVQTVGFRVVSQSTTGISREALRFLHPRTGTLRHALRQSALRLAPQLAPAMFVFHSSLLCTKQDTSGSSLSRSVS